MMYGVSAPPCPSFCWRCHLQPILPNSSIPTKERLDSTFELVARGLWGSTSEIEMFLGRNASAWLASHRQSAEDIRRRPRAVRQRVRLTCSELFVHHGYYSPRQIFQHRACFRQLSPISPITYWERPFAGRQVSTYSQIPCVCSL